MFEGISEYEAIKRKYKDLREPLIKRKHLLGMLLTRRSSLRVLCAPARFGKSVLAYQYACEAFEDGAVRWIDASEPSFLIELDALQCISTPTADVRDEGKERAHPQLIVIDECPVLDTERFSFVCALIEAQLQQGNEVIVTTSDTRWAGLKEPYPEVIDAQLLLLTKQECTQGDTLPHEQGDLRKDTSESRNLLQQVVGYRLQSSRADELFFDAIMSQQITSGAQALTVIMLVLGSGALHELSHYVQPFDRALMHDLERFYPYVGITALSPLFTSVTLSEQQRFALIRHHLVAVCAALSRFDSEEQLLDQLLEDLLKRKRFDLATQLVCGLPECEKRMSFFDEHAMEFLYLGKPLALLYLARTLPQESFSVARRMHAVVYALALVGEKDGAQRLIFACRSIEPKESNSSFESSSTVADVGHPPTLDEVLAQILLGNKWQFAKQALSTSLSACIEFQQTRCCKPTDRPRFADDLVKMLAYTLENPSKGYQRLNELTSCGYSMKETLCAFCVFARMLIFVWQSRNSNDLMKKPTQVCFYEGVEAAEKELLEDLGHLVARILTRAIEVLPPNCIELVLFAALRELLGERVYLFLSDSILGRIQLIRDTLAQQRRKWKQVSMQEQLLDSSSDQPLEQLEPLRKKALRINTFGRFEIEVNDPSVTIKGKVRKQLRLLIGLLAINEGRELARPWVQRTLWPDSPDRNAKQSLYSMWSLLNKSVIDQEGKCPFFESYPQSIALNPMLVETDTQLLDSICKRLRYETLDIPLYEKAIEEIEDIYRGPLLPGEDIAEVVASRKKYHDRLIEALVTGGEQLRKSGATALALRYFRFAFENEPTREDVCYLLMLTLWKLGRHGEALNEYFVCRRALIDRFGIEGTTKLRKLYDAILADAS